MMPNYVYVAAQDDNQIAVFTIDGETGRLTRTAEIPMLGGPSLLAIRPNRHCLYVGHRQVPEISSHRINPATGALMRLGSISPPDAPGFLATDRRGRYLLAAYYQGGRAGVHPLGEDGAIKDPPSAWVPTAVGAHAIQTDRSNRFAFVPHIARLNDNVLEPPKDAVWLKYCVTSRGLSMIVAEQSTEALSPHHVPCLTTHRLLLCDQLIVEPLMIALV